MLQEKNNINSLKIIDFGLATLSNGTRPYTQLVSTRWYRAPEIALRLPWNYKIDMWSIGCILIELYIGRPLFDSQSEYVFDLFLFYKLYIYEFIFVRHEHLPIIESIMGNLPRSMTRGVLDIEKQRIENDALALKYKGVQNFSAVSCLFQCLVSIHRLIQ
jgi:serine/threonine protein kinase